MIKTDIHKAVKILRDGGLVALPTETVYGLAADANNEKAIAKVFQAKNRPQNHPLIVHIAHVDQLAEWAIEIPESAYQLADAFWPGPLTLILNKQNSVSPIITGGQQAVALRIPRHPLALAVLREFGGAVVAPSANQFTHVSPTDAQAVQTELGTAVDFILDGGVCEVGVESTILDLSREEPTILRPGMLTPEKIVNVLGRPLGSLQASQRVVTPGMHKLHYAPLTPTISFTEYSEILTALRNQPEGKAIVLTLNESLVEHENLKMIRMPDEPQAYAKALYKTLRSADESGCHQIWIEAVPTTPAWHAIGDRIFKACGRRE